MPSTRPAWRATRTAASRSHPSRHPSIPRPSGGGSWPPSRLSSGWRSSARQWPVRASWRAATTPRWWPLAPTGGSSSRSAWRGAWRGTGRRGRRRRPGYRVVPARSGGRGARLVETSTGMAFDLLVLPLGALAVVVAVLALSIGPALRAARTVRSGDQAEVARPSAVVARLAAMGAPPTAVIGVRQALQRKHGGTTIPVGTALLGTVLAVMALCGTGVFGASLSHLLASPTLYGDPFQLNFSNAGGQPDPALLRSLLQDRAITRISHGIETESSVNGVTVGGVAATAIRGRLLFSAVAGH